MRQTTQGDHQERMLRVLVHIQRHLDDDLSLDELARVANFSPYHFHRVFRGMVGESVAEHVRRLRLERAAQRLKVGQEAVTNIAFDAGYQTHESFTRAFRAMFGRTPSEFRTEHRPVPLPTAPSAVHFAPDGEVTEFEACQAGGAEMDAEIKTLEPKRVAFMRHVGPYHEVGQVWGRLCQWAGPRGLMGPHMQMLGLCHDDPEVTPLDKIRYDACITAGDGLEAEGDVGVQTIAGGEYAITVHQGPYEKLSETYAALCGQWLPAQGREPDSAPSIEIYQNNPQTTPPKDLRTQVCVRVKPRNA